MNLLYLKIRYRGRLRPATDLSQLADEVEDICQSNGWKYYYWAEDWSQANTAKMNYEEDRLHIEGHVPLKGISFNPGPEAESIWFTFTPDGVLNSLITLTDPTFTANDKTYPWNRVKICSGDVKTYAEVCNLFRFVADKYFDDFQVLEETGYWTHRDWSHLEKFMGQVTLEHKQMEEELTALENDESMDPEKKSEIFYKMLQQFGEQNYPNTTEEF